MSADPARFTAQHPFLICINSDGCAFDTMEIKHKECFCPAYIDHFSLQAVSKYAREAWEYTNLYSVTRGFHRMLTLLDSLDLLEKRSEVRERGFHVPEYGALRRWVDTAPVLSNDNLREAIHAQPDQPILRHALDWSIDVNERVGQMVHGIPPFPHVRECLQMLHDQADIVVVSATQEKALEREWGEHDLMRYVSRVCGQESGSKAQIIKALRPQYADHHVLMIGDALGDLKAAHANGALFYPIRPGEETASWHEFIGILPAFLNATYGREEEKLISRFHQLLPDTPPWQSVS